ncbi:hypothetical protein EW146_g4245 [Bondarzewia mesenterica]|uniref:Major facilitator superfamily (MFS) profile domain-containing protein n=1 Tax=Bondarzewia mesenterica TaxID=1095465 RepID=A0A4S4LVP5_9AGAM|nr:hypothetical protein EW146_g4245 [Bondarzewia mesenterica]
MTDIAHNLQGKTQGNVLSPTSPGYREALRRNSDRSVLEAACVAQPAVYPNISAITLFASSRKLEVAVKGGGCHSSTWSSSQGGIVIDLSTLKKGGANWGDVYELGGKEGFEGVGAPLWFVGVCGSLLGWAYGNLTAEHGLGLDNTSLHSRYWSGKLLTHNTLDVFGGRKEGRKMSETTAVAQAVLKADSPWLNLYPTRLTAGDDGVFETPFSCRPPFFLILILIMIVIVILPLPCLALAEYVPTERYTSLSAGRRRMRALHNMVLKSSSKHIQVRMQVRVGAIRFSPRSRCLWSITNIATNLATMSNAVDVSKAPSGSPLSGLERAELSMFVLAKPPSGRLVVHPVEAEKEFGHEIASRLKRTPDGAYICWPQPSDDVDDPLNWSSRRKNIVLTVYCLAAFVPDFSIALSVPVLFNLAEQFGVTTEEINDLATNWPVFLLGLYCLLGVMDVNSCSSILWVAAWGGVFSIAMISRFGRLPVLFWSQACAWYRIFDWCDFSSQSARLRSHEGSASESRKLNIWTYAFLLSPYISPLIGNFIVASGVTWRWVFGFGCIYEGLVVIAICLFGEETYIVAKARQKPVATNCNIARGVRLSNYEVDSSSKLDRNVRATRHGSDSTGDGANVCPHCDDICMDRRNKHDLSRLQSLFGYAFDGKRISAIYVTPLVATSLGQVIGHYTNDYSARKYIANHNGVFEPEARIPLAYVANLLMIAGQILLGLYASAPRALDFSFHFKLMG